MKNLKKNLIWWLLALGAVAVMFNSCGDDDNGGGNSNKIAVTGISLDVPTLTLAIGEEYTLTATVMPDNATNKTVRWESSDNTKVTVTNGKVKAVAIGTPVTITAKAGDETATCIVTVVDPLTYDEGVEINGVVWATRNIDAPGTFAARPESTGMYYQWNRRVAWAATGYSVSGWDTSSPTGTDWEEANDPCPAGWRVPTLGQLERLFDNSAVRREWTTENGVNGRKFTDRDTGNSIFLPAAGGRWPSDGTLFYVNSEGQYWSRSWFNFTNQACALVFTRSSVNWEYEYRRNGFTIRAVKRPAQV